MKIPQEVQTKLALWFSEEEMEPVRLSLVSWLFGQYAMTFGNLILMRRDKYDLSAKCLAIIGHELVHTIQYREMGMIKFLAVYCYQRIKGGNTPANLLPLEEPAYKIQREIEKAYESA